MAARSWSAVVGVVAMLAASVGEEVSDGGALCVGCVSVMLPSLLPVSGWTGGGACAAGYGVDPEAS